MSLPLQTLHEIIRSAAHAGDLSRFRKHAVFMLHVAERGPGHPAWAYLAGTATPAMKEGMVQELIQRGLKPASPMAQFWTWRGCQGEYCGLQDHEALWALFAQEAYMRQAKTARELIMAGTNLSSYLKEPLSPSLHPRLFSVEVASPHRHEIEDFLASRREGLIGAARAVQSGPLMELDPPDPAAVERAALSAEAVAWMLGPGQTLGSPLPIASRAACLLMLTQRYAEAFVEQWLSPREE
jgi:hypothetical protein